jgi:hypothetical protein
MEATELRIGNNVIHRHRVYDDVGQYEVAEDIVSILEIRGIGYICYSHSPLINISDIEPIPLTEEWLLRFSFKKNGIEFHLDNGSGLMVIGSNLYLNTINNGRVLLTTIQYVHQLQNLIFSLTGEELTIKQTT